MTELDALLRVEDMAWDARNGLARQAHQHELDADALDILEKIIDEARLRAYQESRPFIDRVLRPDVRDKGIGPYL